MDIGLQFASAAVIFNESARDISQALQSEQHELAAQLYKGRTAAALDEVRSGADNLASASNPVSAAAQSLSQGATEQAASIEELIASVQQNTENACVTNGIATRSADEAKSGGEAVTRPGPLCGPLNGVGG